MQFWAGISIDGYQTQQWHCNLSLKTQTLFEKTLNSLAVSLGHIINVSFPFSLLVDLSSFKMSLSSVPFRTRGGFLDSLESRYFASFVVVWGWGAHCISIVCFAAAAAERHLLVSCQSSLPSSLGWQWVVIHFSFESCFKKNSGHGSLIRLFSSLVMRNFQPLVMQIRFVMINFKVQCMKYMDLQGDHYGW